MNRDELRNILRDLDKLCAQHVKPAAREQVRDVISDLSEYLLAQYESHARTQSMVAKIFKHLGLKA